MTLNKEIWNELHRLQNAACKTGKASAEVDGVGFVEIECERVYVMRSRGTPAFSSACSPCLLIATMYLFPPLMHHSATFGGTGS